MSEDEPVTVDRVDVRHAFASFRCSTSGCSGLVRLYTSDGGRTWVPEGSGGQTGVPANRVKAGGASGVLVYDPTSEKWDEASTDAGPVLTLVAFATRDQGYAITDTGALWFSDDGGATWAPRSDGFSWSIAVTGALSAIGPDGTIRLSDDRGATWRDVRYGLLAYRRRRPHLASDRRYAQCHVRRRSSRSTSGWSPCNAACDEPLRVTSDGGETWQSRPVPQPVYPGFVFATPLDGWASPYNPDGDCRCLLATRDGGLTWQTVSTAPWSIQSLAPVDAKHAFAIARTSRAADVPPEVISTSDGGVTWEEEFSLATPRGGLHAAATLRRSQRSDLAAGVDLPRQRS